MNPRLEIIVPLRNPSDITRESIDSLLAQTNRNFSVLISDNHSTQGLEIIEEARQHLQAAAIPVRIVRPPLELGRVEHWNWAHSEARADWLKPLFVGDILFPTYVEIILNRASEKPHAKFIRCEMENRQEGKTINITQAPLSELSLAPEDFLRYYPHLGNWIGGPVNVAYHRLAWQMSGGYMPQLPACADLQLYVTMILRHGLESIPTPLAAFQLHPQRFSHKITKRRVNGLFELWIILRHMQNQARENNLPLSSKTIRAALWLQFLFDYAYPFKNRLKPYLPKIFLRRQPPRT